MPIKQKENQFDSQGTIVNVSGEPMEPSKINHLTQIISRLKKDFVWFSSLTEQTNYCSENIFDVLGYKSEEIKSFNEKRLAISLDEDISRIREKLNEFLTDASLNSIHLNYKIRQKDTSYISVLEKIYAERDDRGEVVNLYGIVSDTSELTENENRLFETINALQKLNDAKDKFVSRISHDLRSPFTSIIGFSEVLINDPKIQEKDKTEYLTYILNSSRNLLHFVNQLSEIIKLQTNRSKLEPQRTNANRLIHYAVSSFTAQVVDKGLEIKVDVSESLHIVTDERLFLMLITNLVSNAVKFSRTGGKINIKAQDFNNDFIEVIVTDEGVGILDKNKSKMFKIDQIFFSEGTKGEKGTGLGLLLSKEIVEKHGGNLWFYSTPNEGSEFHFTIPLSKNTVLVVENDSAVRSSCEKLIKANFNEYNLMIAKDGYEAITLIGNTVPSVIIVNHELPLMTGLQVLEDIVKSHKNEKITAFVITDNLTDDLKDSYSKLGVKVFLTKPISLKLLQKKFEELKASGK